MTSAGLSHLEQALDSFEAPRRRRALLRLAELARRREVTLPETGDWVNLHCHTFYSYNPYGYSPSKLAWLARRAGLAVAGIVDFDVLDGLEEFHRAGRLLNLKTCVGLETRVYVPEFAQAVMNSPGEPGISYHMGVGFPSARLDRRARRFLASLRRTSEERNRALVERVNAYLKPVTLDYDRDVLPLTPRGNATERHLCLAYAQRAAAVFPGRDALAAFWSERLGLDARELDLPDGFRLQSAIRAKTMKQGGVGYVQPDRGSFPRLHETCEFVLAAGGIPTHTWLDGTSDGEQRMAELLEVEIRSGVAALNVIPDRNYTPEHPDEKLRNLQEVVALADTLGLLVVAGTEMNSPGHKLVDDFSGAELAPLLPLFRRSAYAVYAHSVLQRASRLGYTSEWARRHFPALRHRAEFFAAVGEALVVAREGALDGLSDDASPDAVLAAARGAA